MHSESLLSFCRIPADVKHHFYINSVDKIMIPIFLPHYSARKVSCGGKVRVDGQ